MEPGNEGTTHIDQFTDSLIPVRVFAFHTET